MHRPRVVWRYCHWHFFFTNSLRYFYFKNFCRSSSSMVFGLFDTKIYNCSARIFLAKIQRSRVEHFRRHVTEKVFVQHWRITAYHVSHYNKYIIIPMYIYYLYNASDLNRRRRISANVLSDAAQRQRRPRLNHIHYYNFFPPSFVCSLVHFHMSIYVHFVNDRVGLILRLLLLLLCTNGGGGLRKRAIIQSLS